MLEPIPADLTDPARLAALNATGLLDAPVDEVLDRLARAATQLLGVPVALVSLVDDRGQRFPGLAGLTGWAADQRGTPLSHSFCQHVVTERAPLVVPDALADPRVRDNPAIRDLQVRSYLGVPLSTPDGHTLGAMCAIDGAPRSWTHADVAALQDLAAAAAAALSLRTALRALQDQAEVHRASVDFNPQMPWIASAEGDIVDISPSWYERTGVTATASHGNGWVQAMHPEETEAMWAAWQHAVRTGEPYDVQHRLRMADGSYRWMRSRARPQRDATGRILRWFGWSEDVHAQVLGQEEYARFALAARGTVDGLWTWDFTTQAVFISPRYRELLGYSEREFPDSADAFFALVHPDDRPQLDAALQAHLDRQTPFDLELRLRHRDGTWRWFWDRGQAEWDADGRSLRMAGSVSDITDRRADRAARELSEARYRLLLEAAHEGICTTDEDGILTYANPRLYAMLGYDAPPRDDAAPGALVGRSYFDLLEPAERPGARERLARLGQRVADTRELTLRRADGAPLVVLEATSALLRDDGTVEGALFILSDLSERRRMEASLRTSEARLAGIIGSAMDAIVTVDAEQRIVLANAAAERVFGYGPDELVGCALDVLVPGRVRDRHRVHLAHFANDGMTTRAMGRPGILADGDIVGLRKDGTEFPFEASISQVVTEEGRFFTVILHDVTDRRAAEAERARAVEALRASDERYALAARATRQAIWDWNLTTHEVTWNEGAAAVLGHQESGGTDREASWWMECIHPDDRQRVLDGIHAVIDDPSGGVEWQTEYRFRRGDGTYLDIDDHGYVARDATGRAVRMVGAMADVTATRVLEEQLRQAQKMEAVGQLAGGVAHDFNNLLTVIGGNVEFLRLDLGRALPHGHRAYGELEQIAIASERAAALVRQLLTFSRRQPVRPQRVQLGAAVEGAAKLLRRVIGEEIVLEVAANDGDARIEADPGQLEQVLMNLVVNARDAMLTPMHGHPGRGGVFTVEIDVVTLGAADALRWDGGGEVRPGRWVRLRTRDSGHGMDEATRRRVFEPFFTTKPVGAGTGLGLATVFGIVRQAGGAVRVDSAPGLGTTFTLLFPAVSTPHQEPASFNAMPTPPQRSALVLLVEDETPVRAMARRMLERQGYSVLEAHHGGDALLVWREYRDRIDAVVTDLRMPELGGRELIALMRAERPDLPTVLMSGYADQEAFAVGSPHERFLGKPFTGDALLAAVASVLTPPGHGGA